MFACMKNWAIFTFSKLRLNWLIIEGRGLCVARRYGAWGSQLAAHNTRGSGSVHLNQTKTLGLYCEGHTSRKKMQFWDTIDITSTYLGFWESSVEQAHRKQTNLWHILVTEHHIIIEKAPPTMMKSICKLMIRMNSAFVAHSNCIKIFPVARDCT